MDGARADESTSEHEADAAHDPPRGMPPRGVRRASRGKHRRGRSRGPRSHGRVHPRPRGLPDFWGIALWVGNFAIVLVVLSAAGTWHYVPATFGAFASVFFWWTATGLDYWAPDGGGVGNSLAALADPATAGAGAFGGVISTPFVFVWLNITVSLLCGCVLGILSVKLTGLVTPAAAAEQLEEQPAAR